MRKLNYMLRWGVWEKESDGVFVMVPDKKQWLKEERKRIRKEKGKYTHLFIYDDFNNLVCIEPYLPRWIYRYYDYESDVKQEFYKHRYTIREIKDEFMKDDEREILNKWMEKMTEISSNFVI